MEVQEIIKELSIDNRRVVIDVELDCADILSVHILNISQSEAQFFKRFLSGSYSVKMYKYLNYGPTLLIE